jgi:hypothetical protein
MKDKRRKHRRVFFTTLQNLTQPKIAAKRSSEIALSKEIPTK